MTRMKPDRHLGAHAGAVATEVKAEAYHETHAGETPTGEPPPTGPEGQPVDRRATTGDHRDVRRIIVGVDGSPASLDALRWAADEARVRHAHLTVAIAWKWNVPAPVPMVGPMPGELREAARQALDTAMASVDLTDVEVEPLLVEGEAADRLEELAADADLLVVGSRGRSAVAGVLLGSVSRHCVLHADCPVVVVRKGIAPPRSVPPARQPAEAAAGTVP